jgi:hypothetical protein
MTQTQIDEAFAAMGLAPPVSALLTSLEAIPDTYTALATIIQLPQVQTSVIPIVTMFDLALGHDPTSATLSSIVQTNLSQAGLAADFVASQAFANVYNGGVLLNPNTVVTSANDSIITALFVNGLGHAPTQATLNGFHGLTLATAFLEFSQSQAAGVSPIVDASLTQILELATGIPAQAPPVVTQDFTLTTSQDSVVSGQNTVNTTTPGVAVQSTGNVTVNAPLSGAFNLLTLSPGDDINLAGSGNILNADFHGSAVVNGVTILGAQTWNITQLGGNGSNITIEGNAGALDGLTTLTYTGNGINSSTLQVGLLGHTVDATTPVNGFNLQANNIGFDSNLIVFLNAGSFSGNDQINVTANQVGNTTGTTSTSIVTSTFIEAGSGGAAGFATWNVDSTGAAALNNIGLGALGSSAATTLDVEDDGSATIIFNAGDPGDWKNLQVINALGTTGALTITGGEFGGFGLLSDDTTALKEVLGGSGADTFDLSAYAGTLAEEEALQINGGGNAATVVELSSAMINQISAAGSTGFSMWAGVPNLLWVGTDATSDVGGAMNWAMFPGTTEVSLADRVSGIHANQTSNIVVTKAPDGGTFNFQDANQNGHNFSITGADTAGGAGNVINVDYSGSVNSTGKFASSNFDFVNVNVNTGGATEHLYSGGISATANADAQETLTINATGGGTLDVGTTTASVIGTDSITLLGGPIVVNPPHATFTDTGTLDITGTDNVLIGVTNASAIHSTTTGAFVMDNPDDFVGGGGGLWTAGPGIVVSSTSAHSILDGSTGSVTGNEFTATGNDMLTDLAGSTDFFGGGGADTINIADGGNTIHFGTVNDNGAFAFFGIENGPNSANLGSWGATSNAEAIFGAGSIFGGAHTGGTQADMTTINGFTIGTGGDNLSFDPNSWGGNLVDAHAPGTTVSGTAAGHTFAVGFAGEGISTSAFLTLDEITQFSNATGLASSLATETVGNIHLGANIANGATVDFLVAYEVQGGTAINIADVEVHNGSGAATNDTGVMQVYAWDMVHLANVAFGLTALGINAGEIHFGA